MILATTSSPALPRRTPAVVDPCVVRAMARDLRRVARIVEVRTDGNTPSSLPADVRLAVAIDRLLAGDLGMVQICWAIVRRTFVDVLVATPAGIRLARRRVSEPSAIARPRPACPDGSGRAKLRRDPGSALTEMPR